MIGFKLGTINYHYYYTSEVKASYYCRRHQLVMIMHDIAIVRRDHEFAQPNSYDSELLKPERWGCVAL